MRASRQFHSSRIATQLTSQSTLKHSSASRLKNLWIYTSNTNMQLTVIKQLLAMDEKAQTPTRPPRLFTRPSDLLKSAAINLCRWNEGCLINFHSIFGWKSFPRERCLWSYTIVISNEPQRTCNKAMIYGSRQIDYCYYPIIDEKKRVLLVNSNFNDFVALDSEWKLERSRQLVLANVSPCLKTWLFIRFVGFELITSGSRESNGFTAVHIQTLRISMKSKSI